MPCIEYAHLEMQRQAVRASPGKIRVSSQYPSLVYCKATDTIPRIQTAFFFHLYELHLKEARANRGEGSKLVDIK